MELVKPRLKNFPGVKIVKVIRFEMKWIFWIEQYFWLAMLIGLALGFIYPDYSAFLLTYLEWSLIAMLILVFLKIDFLQTIKSFKNMGLILYITFMLLIVVPVLVYWGVYFIAPSFALGMLLLAAMPAGTASPALSDLMKGNVELSLSLTVVTSLLAPLTVPLLFNFLAGQSVLIEPLTMFRKLGFIILTPILVSWFLKRFLPAFSKKLLPFSSAINVFLLFLFVYATIGSQRDTFLEDPVKVFWQLLVLYGVYIFFHVSGFLMSFKMPYKDRISVVVANAYQNNGMAIVLAVAFFEPSVVVLVLLSEFPWNTMPALLGWLIKRWDNRRIYTKPSKAR